MADVVPLRRCRRCGAPAVPRTLVCDGWQSRPIDVCDDCLAQAQEGLEAQRKVYEALLEMGIDARVADAMMVAKIRAEKEGS